MYMMTAVWSYSKGCLRCIISSSVWLICILLCVGVQQGVPALVSYEPYVAVRELRRGSDLCLILASDGIWDVLT
jgi:serine/threonine protein phosphatase PrpC